jgi:hypothetical protein
MYISTQFGVNWPIGFREEDWNVKVYSWQRVEWANKSGTGTAEWAKV